MALSGFPIIRLDCGQCNFVWALFSYSVGTFYLFVMQYHVPAKARYCLQVGGFTVSKR